MKEEFQNILIEKHLRGKTNSAENAELKAWRTESAQNQRHFEEIEKIDRAMQSMNFSLDADTNSEWQKLHQKIGQSGAKIVPMKSRFNFLKIAAVFALLLATGWLLKNQFATGDVSTFAAEYDVAKGKTEIIELTDGTKVHLNADSKLAVFADFNLSKRRVKLTGEAYFEVAKNKDVPFLIETGKVTTKVVGTAFNLTAYPENDKVAINVTEGIVEFADDDEKVRLTVNKAAQFDVDEGTIMEVPFQAADLAWQTGSLSFKNKPFSEILISLERKYNVSIKDNSGSENRMLTEEVEPNEKVEDVLTRLGMTTNLTLEKEENTYTFKKK